MWQLVIRRPDRIALRIRRAMLALHVNVQYWQRIVFNLKIHRKNSRLYCLVNPPKDLRKYRYSHVLMYSLFSLQNILTIVVLVTVYNRVTYMHVKSSRPKQRFATWKVARQAWSLCDDDDVITGKSRVTSSIPRLEFHTKPRCSLDFCKRFIHAWCNVITNSLHKIVHIDELYRTTAQRHVWTIRSYL